MEWKARLFGARRPARRRDRFLEGVERLEPRAMLAAFTLEAENGVLTGVNRSSSVAGFSGSGYVTGFDADGDRVSWNGFSAEPGPYRMVIRFRSPFGGKGFAGSLNGVAFSGMFPQSSPFATYDAGLVTLAATNSMEIGGGWNYYEIDAVSLTPEVPMLPQAVPGIPVNPNATPMARALLSRMVEGYGSVTLSGQNDTKDLALIQSASGKLPALVEGDFMDYSPSRVAFGANPGSLTETYIARAKNQGQLISMAWHWNAPTKLVNSGDYPWWRGFYTAGTTFDIAATLANPAGSDYRALVRDIDAIAVQLKKFADADVPVLWRPLHESEGGWFWWGAKGPEAFKQLWRLTYDRLTNHHGLDNLVWVLTSEDPAWYPGDDVVDIIGVDAYPGDRSDTLSARWSPLLQRFDGRKPLALTEFGGVPDIDAMKQVGVTWAYFFSWNGSYGPALETAEKIRRVYTSENVITKDENPPLVAATNPGVVSVAAGATQTDATIRTGVTPLVKRGGGTLVLTAAGSFNGGTVVEEGELVIKNTAALGAGGLEVRAGARVRLDVGFGQVTLERLDLDPAGRLELGTGQVAVAADGLDLAVIRQLLIAGRNGGGWDGSTGITSAAAAIGSERAVGSRLAGGVLTLAWAAPGDTNLDGLVGIADMVSVTSGGKYGTAAIDATWADGDFNYDGRVSITDIAMVGSTGLWNRPSYREEPPIITPEPPVELPAPPPAEPAPVAVAFEVTNSWPGNISGRVTIRNESDVAIDGWTLEFDMPATLAAGNLWGAEIVSSVDNRYRLRNASWTAAIPAGGSVSFTFNAGGQPSAVLTNLVFNGLPVG
jgi:mannan endo-1,4-beta-mannosidase